MPRTALTGLPEEPRRPGLPSPPLQSFVDPDPFQEIAYPTPVAAKLAIADYLAMPLAKLSAEQRTAIEDLLRQTLRKQDILTYIRTTLQPMLRR